MAEGCASVTYTINRILASKHWFFYLQLSLHSNQFSPSFLFLFKKENTGPHAAPNLVFRVTSPKGKGKTKDPGKQFATQHPGYQHSAQLTVESTELTTPENTTTCHNALCLSPQNFASTLFSVSLGAILTKKRN